MRNHQSGALKSRDPKWLPCRSPFLRIKMNPPDIKETSTPGKEINCPSIRRPTRLIVPLFAVCDARPLPARGRHHIECGLHALSYRPGGLKNNPPSIRRKMRLPDIVCRVGNKFSCRRFCVRCRTQGQSPYFRPMPLPAIPRNQELFVIGRQIVNDRTEIHCPGDRFLRPRFGGPH